MDQTIGDFRVAGEEFNENSTITSIIDINEIIDTIINNYISI